MNPKHPNESSGEPFPIAIRRRIRQGVTPRHPSRRGDRDAAVLLPLYPDPRHGPSLLGIIRASGGHHGGQFAFPGGRFEDEDDGPWDAALREAEEEIGLRSPLQRLGILGQFNTVVSSYRVVAAIAWLEECPRAFDLQEEEVAAVLSIPLTHLRTQSEAFPEVLSSWELPIDSGFEFDPEDYRVAGVVPRRGDGHRIGKGESAREMPFIWGLSARILWELLRVAR